MNDDTPDRPDLKMGGIGDELWIEIDFFWELHGLCVLLDQPIRHSRYTRRIDLARDALLRELGLDVLRVNEAGMATSMDCVQRLLHARRDVRRRVYRPESRFTGPLVNVTRNVAWLAGRDDTPAVPPSWPRHYDRHLVTWNFDPGDGALLPIPNAVRR